MQGRATHEGWRLRKDESKFWANTAITALHNDVGEVIGFSKVTRDLTERKLAEDKLKAYTVELEAQNRELEQFAYVASHDLQEPLRKIQTFCEVIQKNSHDEATMERYFPKIIAAAQRMTELIRSVLNYSRLSREGIFIPIDFNSILANILNDFELLIAEKEAEVQIDHLPAINGIPLQISQLLSNLVGNALKFTLTKPVIRITSRIVSGDEFTEVPIVVGQRHYLEISIEDNGIGFDQKYEKLIFAMFQRLNSKHEYAGTGIGLALCKKIAENHHGFITASSEPGKGSTFRVYLPTD
jgi:signal transduction histidine kinase